jgi:polysaccharide export outer membrane protein
MRINSGLILLILVSLFSSCVSYERQAYFQGLRDTSYEYSPLDPELIIEKGDQLSIRVYAMDPTSTISLNEPMGMGMMQNQINNPLQGGGNALIGYLVDELGHVEFAKLGKRKVAGMTHRQLADSLQVWWSPFVKEPVISVRLLNFRVTYLTTSKASTQVIMNARTNLPQFLGMVGGIEWLDQRHNITVIRDYNGKRQVFHMDLTNPNILNSEGYYLLPNDVVYVEPNKQKFLQSNVQSVSLLVSLASTLSVLVLFVNNLVK